MKIGHPIATLVVVDTTQDLSRSVEESLGQDSPTCNFQYDSLFDRFTENVAPDNVRCADYCKVVPVGQRNWQPYFVVPGVLLLCTFYMMIFCSCGVNPITSFDIIMYYTNFLLAIVGSLISITLVIFGVRVVCIQTTWQPIALLVIGILTLVLASRLGFRVKVAILRCAGLTSLTAEAMELTNLGSARSSGAVESDSIRVYSKQISLGGEASEDSCSICLEDLTSDSQRLLNCGHAFHEQCLKQWVRGQHGYGETRHCPNCRVPVDLAKGKPSHV